MPDQAETNLTEPTDDSLLKVVGDAVRQFRTGSDLQRAIQQALEAFAAAVVAQRCLALTIDAERCQDDLGLVITHDWKAGLSRSVPPVADSITISRRALASLVCEDRDVSVVTSVQFSEYFSDFALLIGADVSRIFLVALVQVEHAPWGLLVVDGGADRVWSEHELSALGLISNALGAAIERQQTEVERTRFDAFIQNSEDAIISKTLDGIVIDWNGAAERIYGYSREEMVGQSLTKIVPPRLHEELQQLLVRLKAGERIEHHETSRVRKDGQEVAISLSISPVYDQAGSISGAVTIARDVTARRMAEAALEASEERLRIALDAGNIGAWDWDVNTNLVVWSPNMERLHGLSPGSFDGTFEAYTRGIHPEDAYRVTEALERALADEEELRLEYRSLRSDGSFQWLATQGIVMRDLSGRPLRMTGVCHDVTERKQVQATQVALLARLQRAHAEADAESNRLRDLFQHAPSMMALLEGPEHRFVLANDHYLRSVGYRDVIGRRIAEALPEFEDQGLVALLDQVYRDGTAVTRSEHPVQVDMLGDGVLEQRYFSFAYQPLREESGEVSGILVQAIDLTDQVRARHRVEQLAAETASERDRLQQIIDVLPEAVAITDERGEFVIVNSTALQIWGQSPPSGGVPSYEVFECFHDDGSKYRVEDLPLSRSLYHGEVVLGEQLSIRNAERGELIPVLINSVPLLNNEGDLIGGMVIFQDISVLKEFEHQKDEFLQAVSHDLRNPMTTILGNVQLLRRLDTVDDVRVHSSLSNMESATRRALALVDEILDLTRLQMGRPIEMARTSISLVELVAELAEQHQAMTTAHAIVVDAPDVPVEGYWDQTRLERVFANLLGNAISYSPNGGTIRISIQSSDESASVKISDEGVGIPAADFPHLFDRFWRGSNVRQSIQGTGLGLAGAKAIVEAHGGSISVESVEGEGATFTVLLPLDETNTDSPDGPHRTLEPAIHD